MLVNFVRVLVRGILVQSILLVFLLFDDRFDACILVVLVLLYNHRLDAGILLVIVRFLVNVRVLVQVVVRSVNVQLHLIRVLFVRLHHILLFLVQEHVVFSGLLPFLSLLFLF